MKKFFSKLRRLTLIEWLILMWTVSTVLVLGTVVYIVSHFIFKFW